MTLRDTPERDYPDTFQARVDYVKQAIAEIVDETEQDDRIDELERWASAALDMIATDADALLSSPVPPKEEKQ